MELFTREIGFKINSMDMERKLGKMGRNMKGSIRLGRSMVREVSSGMISLHMWGNFIITTLVGREFIFGMIRGSMTESGNSIRWMAMGNDLSLIL